METVIVIIVVAILGYHLVRAMRRRGTGAKVEQETPAISAAAVPDASVTSDTNSSGSLAQHLHELEGAIASFGSSSAHPGELSQHAEFKRAASLLADHTVPLATVLQYALGANWALSCAGLAALSAREDREQAADQVSAHFDKLAPWAMYFAFEYFLQLQERPPVGVAAVGAKEWWRDNPFIAPMFRDYFVRREELGDHPDFGSALHAPAISPPAIIRDFLARVDHPFAHALVVELDHFQRSTINREFLATFGRFWSDEEGIEILIEPDDWQQPLATAAASLQQPMVRSLLVSGEQLVGKTSFLRLLARRVAAEGWTVFAASGADLMAGQQWFGQLEGRIRQVVDEITVEKKLIWYIPDLLQLARSGTHQGQSASILDQVLPAIVSGRLVAWTETTPSAAARLLQMRPALRHILELIRLEPQSEQATLSLAGSLLGSLSQETGISIERDCADLSVSCARQYLSPVGFPGSALLLIKLTVARAETGQARIEPHDLLTTLSQLTGLPLSILDSRERIDLGSVRKFFASRVIGQDEAVASIVARIAMLKAGLSDPARPIGVFLFAGPTGTGKTELAKTAAEYLFGSVNRLIRLDMSEFQAPESNLAILGGGGYGEPESLISRVRKQPFSVVLLDEFEKAHPRIWDLFLQVFDEGRLTDTLGQVADFRHCLIILTTNLGVTARVGSGFGFASSPDVFTGEDVMRAIAQTYRPEFQNRLDQVIVFRPLTRALMRVILTKELKRILERRGLRDRDWAIEWEASALEFLLEKGFSPEMGARPLKRAIDQYVIAPLAETIVERRFPEGDQFVFFRSDGRSIEAEFVDPDSEIPAAAVNSEVAPRQLVLTSMILSPRGTAEEFAALAAQCTSLEQSLTSPQWDELKQRLSEEMSAPGFWQSSGRHEKLARLALMDRVAAAAGTLGRLRERLARGASRSGRYSRDLVSRLALQLHLLNEGIKDVSEDAPVEVALMVEPTLETGLSDKRATDTWCEQLRAMYRSWSHSRHMQASEFEGSARAGGSVLLVSGFGAHRTLTRECGLHILEITGGGNGAGRATARVRMVTTPLGDLPATIMKKQILAALEKAARPSRVVRRYRGQPAPLVRNADGSWRTGRLDAVMRGDFDLIAADDANVPG